MEFQELQQRLGEIHQKLLEARDMAEAGIRLVDRLILELAREWATRKEERDGGSDPIQR